MSNIEDSASLETIIEHFIDLAKERRGYIRSYYYWKKLQNISYFIKKEVERREGLIRVIDVGCGLGSDIFYLNRMLNKNNIEFLGVDLNPSWIYFCNLKKERYQTDNVKFVVGNAESLNIPENSFDILLSVEVLEHLEKPSQAVKSFYRVLKPRGLAIITTPNEDNPISKVKKLLTLKSSKTKSKTFKSEDLSYEGNSREVGYGHISVKSLYEWIRIFNECKFKVEEILRGSILYGTPKQDYQRVIFAIALLVEALLDRLNLWENLSEEVSISLRKV